MAGSVNKVILIGHLGADPEIRHTNAGDPIANMRIATSETWRDKNSGERKEKTEWHSVVCFNENLAKFAEQYLKKGAKVYIEGALQTRKWEGNDGQPRYTTEVVLQKFRGELQSLDKLPSNRPPPADSQDDYGSQSGRGTGGGQPEGSRTQREIDDEIPF